MMRARDSLENLCEPLEAERGAGPLPRWVQILRFEEYTVASSRKAFSMDHPVVILFVSIAVVASMGLAAEFLKPLALAVLLAFALSPFARFFERRGLPRTPAVVLTVLIALVGLSGIGYVVVTQLNDLAGQLSKPENKARIDRKLSLLHPNPASNLAKLEQTVKGAAKSLQALPDESGPISSKESKPEKLAGAKTVTGEKIQMVEVVNAPKFREQLETAVGPFIEFLTVSSFILILVLFMMVGRNDLGDRIVSLFGGRQISMTTRTMHEVGDRIGRYLATNAMVNACFGLVIGIGVYLIGLPFGALWGVMAALLRFVPYVGTVIAFALPTFFALATSDDWTKAIEVAGLFLVIEMALNSFLEPIIYGKTTGVSALGLLVAAMFWTWLWGVWGLILATPMTVALAVMGKYVPALAFFSKILGEEPDLSPDVRYYQKLIALDEDGASEIIEEAAKAKPRIEVYETILLPALARAERDFSRDEIDERVQAFVWRVSERIIDDLAVVPMVEISATKDATRNGDKPFEVVGVRAEDRSDFLALKMLGQVLDPAVCRLTIRSNEETPLEMAEAIATASPGLVILSHMPPSGLTNARYLVRRLHARLGTLPIVVGRWTEGGQSESTAERLTAAGASSVIFSLTEARDRILAAVQPKVAEAPPLSPAVA